LLDFLPVMAQFNPKIVKIYEKLQNAQGKEERQSLMVEMAEAAAAEYDPTDAEDCDDYHAYFEDFQEARNEYLKAALRVGRLISQTLEIIETQEALESAETLPPLTSGVKSAPN